MATVAHTFIHLDRSFKKGDELDDDDPLVTLAPHLFVQPDPVEPTEAKPVRIRGPLVDTPNPKKKEA